jgi:hypothetical protein
MTDWERVCRALADAGHPEFEYEEGETVIPGLSGEWVVGRVPRSAFESLDPEEEPSSVWSRLVGALPVRCVPTDPERAPSGVRRVAADHGLDVVVVSVNSGGVRVALCDPDCRPDHDQPHR